VSLGLPLGFGSEVDLLTAPGKRLSHQLLAPTLTVGWGGVKVVVAQFDRALQGRDDRVGGVLNIWILDLVRVGDTQRGATAADLRDA
jgi:hypothetical protein